MCVHVKPRVCLLMCTCEHVSMCVSVCTCSCACVCVWGGLCACVRGSCAYVHACVYLLCACVSMRVQACVHV